jgi:DNA-binding winged helix-turn-helix (wHTH) protein
MAQGVVRFGEFEFDTATGELRGRNRQGRLEPQPAALLALLALHPGELVSREQIRRHIWGDGTHVNVSENIAYCVRAIRQALDDDARAPRFVETIPRRGYRFLATVATGEAPQATGSEAPQPAEAAVAGRRWPAGRVRMVAMITMAVLIAAAAELFEPQPNQHHEMAVGALRAIHDLLF